MELNPELAPFTDLLMYETLVDGKPWTHETSLGDPPVVGRSWVGRGVDKLLTLCEAGGGGKVVRQMQMRARIPGLPGALLVSDVLLLGLRWRRRSGVENRPRD